MSSRMSKLLKLPFGQRKTNTGPFVCNPVNAAIPSSYNLSRMFSKTFMPELSVTNYQTVWALHCRWENKHLKRIANGQKPVATPKACGIFCDLKLLMKPFSIICTTVPVCMKKVYNVDLKRLADYAKLAIKSAPV